MKSKTIKTLKNKIKINKYCILIFVLIYFSNETYLMGANKDKTYIIIKYLMEILVLFAEFLYAIIKKKKITKNMLFIYTFCAGLLIISEIFSSSFGFSFVLQILSYTIALLFVINVPIQKFIDSYLKVMVFLSITSLIIYFINIFFHGVIIRFPMVTNMVNYRFYNVGYLGFIPEYEVLSYGHRNFGIFREPGVYASYLTIAMLFLILNSDKYGQRESLRKLILFIITMVSTLSTAGIITMMFILLLVLLKRNINVKIKGCIIFIGIILGILFLTGMFDSVFDKFDSSSNLSGNSTSRINIIIIDLFYFISSPFIGVGMNYYNDSFKNVVLNFNGSIIQSGHDTNTFLKMLAQTGFIFVCIILYGIYKLFKKISKSSFLAYCSIFILIISFSNEDFVLNVMVPILAFYGFKKFENNGCTEEGEDDKAKRLLHKVNNSINILNN